MEEKMESEHSYSGESSSSSSDSSSGSSEAEEEVMEPVRILGNNLELPQELCEDFSLFKEFFSMKTWEALGDEHKEHLKQFLPKFPENDQEEKEKTLKMLFNLEPFHFTSPLDVFYNNLRQGNYRPDIAKMRKFLMKARAKQQKHKIKSYYAKLLPEILISRERLLAAAKACPPGPTPRLPLLPPKPSAKNNYKPLYLRARQRYFEELAAIRSEVGGDESEDDNYPEGPPEQSRRRKQFIAGQIFATQTKDAFSKENDLQDRETKWLLSGSHDCEQRRNAVILAAISNEQEQSMKLNCNNSNDDETEFITDGNVSGTLGGSDASHPTSLDCLKNVLAAHRARRQYRENHPELNTAGITLEDIKQRVALVNGTKKLMFGGQKSDTPIQKLKRGPKKDPGQKAKPDSKAALKKKEEQLESVENKPLLPNIKIKCEQEESDSESSSFVDPMTSPKHAKKLFENVEIKQEVVDMKYPNIANMNYNEPNFETVIKQEPQDPMITMQNAARIVQPVPIKLEDLDGIDMMALPVEIVDDSGEVLHVNTSTETPEDIVDPDEALTETTHANFLSLVRALFPARAAHRASKQQLHARCTAVLKSPIAPLNTWYNLSDNWCADLDSALDFLAGERGPHPDDFVPYLQYMPETKLYQWIGAGRDCDAILGRLCERWLRAASPLPPSTDPPPPKYPTSWVVQTPTNAEILEFRAQERRRFAAAAKPFTYVLHGYRSVVGPCARAAPSCAGQGALLAPERPRHASLLALVRDAVARLPNGEGTRHHVLTLLKMSQWIAPCNEQALMTAVSSALDRLHSAKRDPMVKYDQRTAVWTYLHRHRSEEDWVKTGSSRGRGSKASPALPPPAPRAPPSHHQTSPHAMDLEVGSIEEVVDNGSDTDVDVDDSGSPSSIPHLSSAQLLMQATQANQTKQLQVPNKPKGKLIAVSPHKAKHVVAKPVVTQPKTNVMTQAKQANLMSQVAKQANLAAPSTKQANLITQAVKQSNQTGKQTNVTPQPVKQNVTPQAVKLTTVAKQNTTQVTKQTTLPTPSPKSNLPSATKQASLMAQSAKQANVIAQLTKQTLVKQSNIIQSRQVNVVKQAAQSPKQINATKQVTQPVKQAQTAKQNAPSKQEAPKAVQVPKSVPSVVAPPHKSPLLKQRPLQKQIDTSQAATSTPSVLTLSQQTIHTTTVVQPTATVTIQNQNKVVQGTRSLLIRPPAIQTTVTAALNPVTQVAANQRRGVVRVLSPATPAAGKSLISPRALMQQGIPTTKKRTTVAETASVTTLAQNAANATTVVSSVPTAVTSSVTTRTVQLAGGRTVQLAANQTVHLPGGQAVQLTSGHTLQLSSLQLPTHSVRLPSGQTVQLASPQAVQAIRAVSSAAVKSPTPRVLQSSPTVKTQTNSVQIPISTVQLAGQTVQIGGQTVQLAGQSVQLTGHTVKLPSGQSVQVASQSVLPSQSVQLTSGQTVQLASGNVQLGQNVLSNQSVQMPSGQSVQLGSQTVQLAGQTVQLAGGQTVQLPNGQTIQLASGQTVQLSSGQTLQLASGQAVQLANQQAQKPVAQVVRSQASAEKTAQPIVAKLLTNAQGQMISLEGAMGGARALQVSGMRVLSPAARMTRPLLLTAGKPLHNIILQQSDGSAIRVTSTGGVATSQTIVLSNIGAQSVTTSTTSAPVLKLQQVNPIQQLKLQQGIKIQQSGTSGTVPTSAVRSVLMDGQQLKLVGGRHVLARILRPAHPPPPQ